MTKNYFATPGGMPAPNAAPDGRAIFTSSYAVIPGSVMRDIVTSRFPGWTDARAWVLARPLSGFAETFAWAMIELEPNGGSSQPEPDPVVECVIFVAGGKIQLDLDGQVYALEPGGYAYLPAGQEYQIKNSDEQKALIHWIRKRYVPVSGIAPPNAFVSSDQSAPALPTTAENSDWLTTRFVDPQDMSHDMHVNIVTFEPGAAIPFAETHVMEHGIFILEGTAEYLLNDTWISVEAGDFLWLRAFCPQACKATGTGPFRYLLYKDANRHMPMSIGQ